LRADFAYFARVGKATTFDMPKLPASFLILCLLWVGVGCSSRPTPSEANPQLAEQLTGEWALAEVRKRAANGDTLSDPDLSVFAALFQSKRTHLDFNPNGTCRLLTYHSRSRAMREDRVGEWGLAPNGSSVEMDLGPRFQGEFQLAFSDSQLVVSQPAKYNRHVVRELVLVRPHRLPPPGSPEDTQRRMNQLNAESREAVEALDTIAAVFRDQLQELARRQRQRDSLGHASPTRLAPSPSGKESHTTPAGT
jgi:hypothetical protein